MFSIVLPTNVIFGVDSTFLARGVGVATALTTVLLTAAATAADFAVVEELPDAGETTTGSVEGIGFPRRVCSFNT